MQPLPLALLAALGVAFAIAVVTLVHEWRWRGAPARPPLPGARTIGWLAAVLDSSMAVHVLRRLRASVPGRADLLSDRSDPMGAATGDDGPRTIRPTRLVVSGSSGPILTGSTTAADRPDPRVRLARDLVAVAGLGAAVIMVLVLMPPTPPTGSEVLGATGTPEARTPLPALVTQPPGWTPGPSSTPPSEPDPSSMSSPTGVEPSLASPSQEASSTTTSEPFRATPRPTPRPETPRPLTVPTPTPTPTPPPSESPPPSTEPSPTASAPASASPPPGASPSPSPSTSVEPSPPPSESPPAEPSPSPTSTEPSPSPSPAVVSAPPSQSP